MSGPGSAVTLRDKVPYESGRVKPTNGRRQPYKGCGVAGPRTSGTRMRSKWVLRIHLYLGLLCSSYLVLFGVSSLMFNHPFDFTKPADVRVTWERELSLPPAGSDNTAESEAVRDALGLVGWTIPWETTRDAGTGDLTFGLARPGKHYTIHALRS